MNGLRTNHSGGLRTRHPSTVKGESKDHSHDHAACKFVETRFSEECLDPGAVSETMIIASPSCGR